jgi:acetyltransferase
MTTRNLDALFDPRAIAMIGASGRPGSVGAVATRNLREAGFAGRLMLVNPHGESIDGLPVAETIADLPETPDLAVIATPAETVPSLIGGLGAHGCRAAVVISAGFEGAGRPAALKQAMLDAARPHLLRIVGPNCLGFLSPGRGINASFAQAMPPAGDLALVVQSGAVAAAAMDWAWQAGVGFSHVVTLGDCADVDVADVLDYLAADAATRSILLYLEGVADGRKFMSAARAAARAKPVAVLKAGRSAAGARAALSHTGALAGAAAVYSAAFRRAGLLEVDSLSGLFQAAALFHAGLKGSHERLAILTNGGGAGVLAVDALTAIGGQLAQLSPDTLAALNKFAPAAWSHGNPVDILGDAHPQLYGQSLRVLLAAPETDAVLVLNCPTAVADSTEAAARVITSAAVRGDKPVITAWLGGPAMAEPRRRFAASALPTFETPEAAVEGFAQLTRLRRTRDLVLHAPETAEAAVDADGARKIVEGALAQGRSVLTDPEARDLMQAYGVSTVASRQAATPQDAAEAARAIGGPVALKILSRDVSHKSDVGGVRLGLSSPDETLAAANAMLATVKAAQPAAILDGFIVEPMVARPAAEELLAGIVQDPTFGPLVMVGQGGVAVEVIADRALGLPPLNPDLARDMIAQTQVSRRLAGYRDRPPADLDALAGVLVALGRLASDLPEVAELDINPLLCDASGVLALDGRVAIRAVTSVTPRPAILPYPSNLARDVTLGEQRLRLRPIRPTDAARLQEMIDRSAPEDVRLRFRGSVRRLTDSLVSLLTQIDYDRHMALVAEDSAGALLGVGRLVSDPEGDTAEFALMVRTDRQRRGLGHVLLRALISYARARGLREVWGNVAYDNARMQGVARSLGFQTQPLAEPNRLRVFLDLGQAAVAA